MITQRKGVASIIFLQLAKGEFVKAIPYKLTRRSFISSVIQFTDLRGLRLRRWLRKTAVLNNI